MDDLDIIELYFARDEKAIRESDRKYGALCRTIAKNILDSAQDAEECVSDTWMRAWNIIPPERPHRLEAFFASITRNLALDRWRQSRTEKNGGGTAALCLDGLKNTVSASADPVEDTLLRDLLNRFLRELKPDAREIFLLRYWYFCSIEEITHRTGKNNTAVRVSLFRTREKLRKYLEKEGITP